MRRHQKMHQSLPSTANLSCFAGLSTSIWGHRMLVYNDWVLSPEILMNYPVFPRLANVNKANLV
jgi:hypothetical protein